jgi:hypothetical protein
MHYSNERPPSAKGGLSETSYFAGDGTENTKTPIRGQEKNRPSAAVAAAIERNHKRLLAIKRGSIWSLANMAGASHDALMEALENCDDEEIIERGKDFIEDSRGFAKLLANFRDTREANQ